MIIATWNVNGVRARQAQLQELLDRVAPDVLCLQELKAAPDQLPVWLLDLEDYWCCWHGDRGYSGVGLLLRRSTFAGQPRFEHPPFDHEHRIVTAALPPFTIASVYVPNGGKDFQAKLRFLEAMDAFAAEYAAAGRPLVLCGDINVARADMDVHPKERKPTAIGQLPEERALLAGILDRGLVDVHRALDPDNAELFTWWAPWRNLRQRNIGWRIDYVLASRALAAHATSCVVERETGTSDHGPIVARFEGIA
ncbi:MAG: exodeoxyribonuclease III [Acidimicrobiia bacterium]|nr:exodeoxyribonuclease III [Acidimicrobiia bacterium]